MIKNRLLVFGKLGILSKTSKEFTAHITVKEIDLNIVFDPDCSEVSSLPLRTWAFIYQDIISTGDMV